MEAINIFYSSVTDFTWFPGNPDTNKTRDFTWAISSSLLSGEAADWQMSFSEAAANYTNIHGSLQVTASMTALHRL